MGDRSIAEEGRVALCYAVPGCRQAWLIWATWACSWEPCLFRNIVRKASRGTPLLALSYLLLHAEMKGCLAWQELEGREGLSSPCPLDCTPRVLYFLPDSFRRCFMSSEVLPPQPECPQRCLWSTRNTQLVCFVKGIICALYC